MTLLFDNPGTQRGALISDDGVYRYRLWRRWAEGQLLTFCMLNPSKADGTEDDPTIRVCCGRARLLGYAGIMVINAFAMRSTNPMALYSHPDPIGPSNDAEIAIATAESPLVVCAWGLHGKLMNRGELVKAMLPKEKLRHLGLTREGQQPRHPLRVPYSQQLQEFA